MFSNIGFTEIMLVSGFLFFFYLAKQIPLLLRSMNDSFAHLKKVMRE